MYQTIDLEALKEVIEEKTGMEVGLRYKIIYQGKKCILLSLRDISSSMKLD